MNRLIKYKIKIPLTYNHFEIKNIDPKVESEFRVEIDGNVEEKLQSDEKITVRLYNIFECDGKTPKPLIMCDIEGIVSEEKDIAVKIAENILSKICREMSFLFNRHNRNRHLYQPRIEADWQNFRIDSEKYSSTHICKDDGIPYYEDGIIFKESLQMTVILNISSTEFTVDRWLNACTPEETFVCNEYYAALGAEKVKSKFFHLFSIIEFCEREYIENNGSRLLMSDAEVENVTALLNEEPNFSDKKNLLSRIKQIMKEATDISRAQKLLNILDWMNIKSFKIFGKEISIDLDLLKSLILLRNKTFHGTTDTSEMELKYSDAVEKLLYIDEMIINFLRKDKIISG